MAKYQLSISNGPFPVRTDEAGQVTSVRTLVVNWTGAWGPRDHPERFLKVAPGDELELVLSPEMPRGGSLWIYDQGLPLFEPAEGIERQEHWERVDFEPGGSGSRVLRVNPALANGSGESRFNVRASDLREIPMPFVGEGQAGSLTASKP